MNLAELAGRQHGVVGRAQLRSLAFDHRAIERMLASGRLQPLHRGVYAVGHRNRSRQARFMAATLATGGALSHRAAGALHSVLRYDGPIEVTVAGKRRQRPGLRLHSAVLPTDEQTLRDGIPVTTPPRTLLDLAAILPPHRLRRAVNEAEVQRLTDDLSIGDLIRRYPGRRGTRTLAELTAIAPTVLRSELEHRFQSLTEQFDLPRPQTNATRGGYELDAVWPDAGLIVELDGRAVHATKLALEDDRERDRKLAVQGWRVIRLTHHQLTTQPQAVADDLHHLLGTGRTRAGDRR